MTAVARILRAPFLTNVREGADPEGDSATILELAFLAACSDGLIEEEEERCLAGVAQELGIKDVDVRLRVFAAALERTTVEERVVEIARGITSHATRRIAYSLVFVIHVSDLNASPGEDDLEILLEKEWGFEQEAADLKDAVMGFLDAE